MDSKGNSVAVPRNEQEVQPCGKAAVCEEERKVCTHQRGWQRRKVGHGRGSLNSSALRKLEVTN